MTKVFVHGNPEDTVALSAPGFGAPAPADWEPTPANYVAWLAAELDNIDGPIDLVGHDWGAGHVFGLLAAHPDKVRSWAADCGGLLHADYVWHDAAQTWQTPGAGEEAIAAMAGINTEDRTAAYMGLGLPADIAQALSEGFTDDMGRCILELYRAAKQPVLAELGQQLVAAELPPGLMIDATGDAYVSSDLAKQMVGPLNAGHLELDGNGHWWMTEDPTTAAAGLSAFWSGLSPTA